MSEKRDNEKRGPSRPLGEIGRPAIDAEVIDALRELQEEGESDLVVELFDMFYRDAPLRIEEMRAAIRKKDAATLGTVAHTMKSASANLGCFPLSELCAELERIGRAGTLVDAQTLFDRLIGEFERVQECFEHQYRGDGASSVAV